MKDEEVINNFDKRIIDLDKLITNKSLFANSPKMLKFYKGSIIRVDEIIWDMKKVSEFYDLRKQFESKVH